MTEQKKEKVLILGGAGMVGVQVAREIARELNPSEIIISSLTKREVDEAVAQLKADAKSERWKIRFVAEPGDIFLPESLQGKSRGDILGDSEMFDQLFDDVFSSGGEAYKNSSLYRLIERHRPTVVVDCINTATAISYQDVYTTSRKVKYMLDEVEDSKAIAPEKLESFVRSIRELLIAQGVPQITRHILFLDRALKDSAVRVYVKVGTTGTGGMGVNIPYTHSEDKPSATLLSKSAIGFAHTGLLFLLARTPGPAVDGDATLGPLIKEVKPGAMIGFKRLGVTHVRLAGSREPGYLYNPHTEKIGKAVQPRAKAEDFGWFSGKKVPVNIVGADTGENGFFSIGEFQAITYPRQMEYVTPEEVARTVVLEILGASTGRDVLAAIDGAITEPSYRAGALRDRACRLLEQLETELESKEEVLPSIALGHLGPPRLSKLLIESYLIRAAAGTSSFAKLQKITPNAMRRRVEQYLKANPKVESLIVTIGIPILRDSGRSVSLTRGPRLNIPVPRPDEQPVPLDADSVERFAFLGWVDLREENFEKWHERLAHLVNSQPDLVNRGSAAFERSKYMHDHFVPGDVVGWLLTNEVDDMNMVGRRLY